ncbi:hypothetical protein L6452_07699 [Arctium lappa]|uniref:Uncharacterized protein n=1 Tax=Arctium lappa TaxID=4217 RepID=A0ACB9ELA4_ARCLA|nr:hypothetical protein L6452_07699 [Arctium lappa]
MYRGLSALAIVPSYCALWHNRWHSRPGAPELQNPTFSTPKLPIFRGTLNNAFPNKTPLFISHINVRVTITYRKLRTENLSLGIDLSSRADGSVEVIPQGNAALNGATSRAWASLESGVDFASTRCGFQQEPGVGFGLESNVAQLEQTRGCPKSCACRQF